MKRPGFLNPTHVFNRLLYARVDRRGKPDLDHPIPSSFASPRYVYLLDIPPGEYLPLGAGYDFMGARYWTRFHEDEVAAWKIRVRPGQLAFLGENHLQPVGEIDVGKTLGHLLRRLLLIFPPWRRPVIRFDAAAAEPDRSADAEIRELRESVTALGATHWAAIAEERLRELGNPPAPLFRGFLFKRPVLPVKTAYFSYDDILGWERPFRVRGGLEWRAPKDRARIAVSFVPADSGTPLEDYLRDLAAAGAPEDSHIAAKTLLRGQKAYRARYTTYAYPRGTILGSETMVFVTEVVVVPKKDGYYLLHLRVKRKYLARYEPLFERFIRRLGLAAPKKGHSR